MFVFRGSLHASAREQKSWGEVLLLFQRRINEDNTFWKGIVVEILVSAI